MSRKITFVEGSFLFLITVMKRFAPVIALVCLLSVLALPLWAATGPTPTTTKDKSPIGPIAGAVTAVTGIAISPLLGTGAYGCYHYFTTPAEARGNLPWFAQASFWLPALALVGAVAAKDAFGAALPPGWKKPLDVLETVENKATGLVAAGAVVPFTMAALSKMIMGSGDATAMTAPVAVGLPGTLATIQLAAFDVSWLLNILTVPFGIAIFAVVWMASHAINGLILLSPWGAIDAALKGGRTALLGLLTLSSTLNPWVSAGFSLVIIIVAYFVAGWSFRLTIFSSIFSWDFFTSRKRRYRVDPSSNKMFAGIGLGTAPQRTYGKLTRDAEGQMRFTFKPWMVLPEKTVDVPAGTELGVGRGAFFSGITHGAAEVFVLPPRYRSHEEELAVAYGLARGVQPIGLRKAWSWLTGSLTPPPKSAAV
jgi:hypothetical protein